MALRWAGADDVKDRWLGGEIPATDAQIALLLEDAEDTVLREFPAIQDKIDADTVPLRRVQKVVARIVIRYLRNPSGYRQALQGQGPFQESVTYSGDEPGTLYLTAQDRAELGDGTAGGAFTIDTMPPQSGSYMWTSTDTWEALP